MIAGLVLAVAAISYGVAVDSAGEFWLGLFTLGILALCLAERHDGDNRRNSEKLDQLGRDRLGYDREERS